MDSFEMSNSDNRALDGCNKELTNDRGNQLTTLVSAKALMIGRIEIDVERKFGAQINNNKGLTTCLLSPDRVRRKGGWTNQGIELAASGRRTERRREG